MEPAAGIVDLGRRFGHQCEYRRFIRVLMIISNDKRIGYNIISALYLIMDIYTLKIKLYKLYNKKCETIIIKF